MSEDKQIKKIKCSINYNEVYSLTGRLLTILDAVYTNERQHQAVKRLIKQKIYDWYDDIEQDQHPEYHAKNNALKVLVDYQDPTKQD